MDRRRAVVAVRLRFLPAAADARIPCLGTGPGAPDTAGTRLAAGVHPRCRLCPGRDLRYRAAGPEGQRHHLAAFWHRRDARRDAGAGVPACIRIRGQPVAADVADVVWHDHIHRSVVVAPDGANGASGAACLGADTPGRGAAMAATAARARWRGRRAGAGTGRKRAAQAAAASRAADGGRRRHDVDGRCPRAGFTPARNPPARKAQGKWRASAAGETGQIVCALGRDRIATARSAGDGGQKRAAGIFRRGAGKHVSFARDQAARFRCRCQGCGGGSRPGDHPFRDPAGSRRKGQPHQQPGQGPGALAGGDQCAGGRGDSGKIRGRDRNTQ